MATRALKGTQFASVLRTAATMTLRGAECSGGGATLRTRGSSRINEVETLRMPLGRGATTPPALSSTVEGPSAPATVRDEEREPTMQSMKLSALAGSVDRMHSVFEEELRGKMRQRALMDELHEDQMRRLGEIGVEIEHSLGDPASHMDQVR